MKNAKKIANEIYIGNLHWKFALGIALEICIGNCIGNLHWKLQRKFALEICIGTCIGKLQKGICIPCFLLLISFHIEKGDMND